MGKKESRPSLRSIATKQAELLRSINDDCYCFEPGMEKIQVEQVLGAEMEQRVVEFDMFVPDRKPPIEQVIDVYVKDICIKSVDVIPNKVIVRGELEVKVMYVADLPDQPVHAFERRGVRWTRDIEIPGAVKEDAATADVQIEFVDYDFCDDEPRKVHITIVLKVWARVTSTAEMDAYVINPVATESAFEMSTAANTVTSSDGFNDDKVSASQMGGGEIEAFGESNVLVTGPSMPTVGPLTPTAGVPTTVSGMAVVNGNSVNVRTGPGTNFPVVQKVNRGESLTIKEEAFGWYKVVMPDGNTTGWVASWLVDTNGTTPAAPKG
ncbi:hypothetical protein SDC9_14741 [bioreactor metagenome]|uniref:SH3b domain-containing protein n=1 Tax=bioreactor metagenome TaxID=1076179 RepID=A0A644TPU5_9ZZZZ